MPFGLHGFDLIALAVVALLVFGPKRLPQMGSAIGETFKSFKHSVNEISGDQPVTAPQHPQVATPIVTASAVAGPSVTHEPTLR